MDDDNNNSGYDDDRHRHEKDDYTLILIPVMVRGEGGRGCKKISGRGRQR